MCEYRLYLIANLTKSMNHSKPFIKDINGSLVSKASSNIALIKYWGKYPNQIPANPSLSYTLTESYTETKIKYQSKGFFKLDFLFEGKENPAFQEKIAQYLKSIREFLPFIDTTHFIIESCNTFPHSSGIASSASSFAALAMGLVKIEQEQIGSPYFDLKKASFLARLGSGSACRSVYNGMVLWGETKQLAESSDQYAVPYPNTPALFLEVQDSIALIDKGVKKVSSTQGHALMNDHPFAQSRFSQAHHNLEALQKAMDDKDWFAFGNIIENEALSLHAMMLTSRPSFILMEPNTLQVIQKIRAFRKQEHLPVFFTLDAGANVHILYPTAHQESVRAFINKEVKDFCIEGELIHDRVKF